MARSYDAYHPVGTTRLGTDSSSVVTPNLRVVGFSNLSLISTSVLPSAGSANPTFSILCLARGFANSLDPVQ